MEGDNDLYLMLGQLKAENIEAKRQRELLFEKISEVKKDTGGLPQLRQDVETMKPVVDDYQKLRQRGIGVIATVGLLSAGGGVALSRLWEKISSLFPSSLN